MRSACVRILPTVRRSGKGICSSSPGAAGPTVSYSAWTTALSKEKDRAEVDPLAVPNGRNLATSTYVVASSFSSQMLQRLTEQ